MVQSPIILQMQSNWYYLEMINVPIQKLKAWNIVLYHNEDSKIQLRKFLYPRQSNCGWFQLFFLTHDRFIGPKTEKQKIQCLVTKRVKNSIQQDFLNRDPYILGGFICYFLVMTILSSQKLKNAKYRFGLQKGVKNSLR